MQMTEIRASDKYYLANEDVQIPPKQLSFFPFIRLKESHFLAKSVARPRKNTYKRIAAVASSHLFKVPQLIQSACTYLNFVGRHEK